MFPALPTYRAEDPPLPSPPLIHASNSRPVSKSYTQQTLLHLGALKMKTVVSLRVVTHLEKQNTKVHFTAQEFAFKFRRFGQGFATSPLFAWSTELLANQKRDQLQNLFICVSHMSLQQTYAKSLQLPQSWIDQRACWPTQGWASCRALA